MSDEARWFRASSWLQLLRGREIVLVLYDGSIGVYLGWRRASAQIRDWVWDGPALRVLVYARVTHGWDPAAVVRWVVRPPCFTGNPSFPCVGAKS